MKILQVMAGGEHGGAETAFVDMCLALQAAGEEIEVVTRPNPVRVPMLERAGITVHTLPFGGALDIYTPWRIARIIRAFSPQIVQTWMSRAAQKTPNWKTVRSSQRYLSVARLGGYYKLSHFRNTDCFTALTPDLVRHITDGGISPDLVRHINNFAETEAVGMPVIRAAYGTPDDAPLILALGRLHAAKAHDVLIHAVSNLPGVHLWIAGEGPDRAALETLIADLGVRDRVQLLGWRTDRAALLDACDICAFISRFEPFGTVFAQAWAAGRPVIVSDADGPRQFCRDGEDCLMVPKDDAAATTAAIQKLLSDNALKDRIVATGKTRAAEEFSREGCVAAYLGFYDDMLRRSASI